MLWDKQLAIVWLLTILILSGCATSEIVPIGTNSYLISQTSAGGMFKSMSSLKVEVIQRANKFAEAKGKIAIPISSKETPSRPGQMPNFEYQFKLVDKDDPEAIGTSLSRSADLIIDTTHTSKTVDSESKAVGENKELYHALLRLEELRKRGLLSEAEFLLEKKKLLKK